MILNVNPREVRIDRTETEAGEEIIWIEGGHISEESEWMA